MFEDYVITNHAIERYKERVDETDKNTVKRIKSDLHFTKVKRIINEENIRYVFARNGKEFIFVKDGNVWILKTIIKRTRNKQKEIIIRRSESAKKGIVIC